MTNPDAQFAEVERLMNEIRDALSWTDEAREVNELKALQLLLDLTRKIHETRNLHELIALILDSAIAFADANRAFVIMLEADGGLRFKMGRDHEKNHLSAEQCTPSTGVIARTLERGRTLLVPDALADHELSKRESVQELNLRTVMCSPLRFKQNTFGVLYVDSQHSLGRYSSSHVNVIASLADQAAVAIRNAQKFETHE
jgi:GAF domain-containing protein